MPTITADNLFEFSSRLLVVGGVADEEAALVAKSLVGANLRGHDSHGVMRIPFYLGRLKVGEVVPGADLKILKETPVILTADAQWGFGQTQSQRLMQRLIEKSRETGIAVGTMIQSAHIGRLGEYCEMALDAQLVAMVMVNTHGATRRVAPPGGKAPRLGTNPIAVGVPCGDRPIVLDIGTSATAEGKVRVKRIAGEQVPDGWLLDSTGKPTNDPATLYDDPPGSILPMGGNQAYKGFGLALIIEIFAGALSGGVCCRPTPINPLGNCVYMQVVDPDHLGGAKHFAQEVTRLSDFMRNCPPIDPSGQITLPGDPERAALEQRTAEGIPLDAGNWQQLVTLAEESGVSVPTVS
jgi:uncharacterized oxidoreductase